ncbi:hypothetical protein ALFP_0732 [Alcaligenes faecalis]|nr:hypothetical protein ALFP_0732 [Alcaligenes faecalis]
MYVRTGSGLQTSLLMMWFSAEFGPLALDSGFQA